MHSPIPSVECPPREHDAGGVGSGRSIAHSRPAMPPPTIARLTTASNTSRRSARFCPVVSMAAPSAAAQHDLSSIGHNPKDG